MRMRMYMSMCMGMCTCMCMCLCLCMCHGSADALDGLHAPRGTEGPGPPARDRDAGRVMFAAELVATGPVAHS